MAASHYTAPNMNAGRMPSARSTLAGKGRKKRIKTRSGGIHPFGIMQVIRSQFQPHRKLQLSRRPGRDRLAEERRTHRADVAAIVDAVEQVERVEAERHHALARTGSKLHAAGRAQVEGREAVAFARIAPDAGGPG